MLYIAKQVRWRIYAAAQKQRRNWLMMAGPWVMGRVACLGSTVHQMLDPRIPLVNTQKGRVDLLMSYGNQPETRPRAALVARYFRRHDLVRLIVQKEAFRWGNHPPVALFMDSLSELVDQQFVNRGNGRRFCSYYSDLDRNEGFVREYECVGLLPLVDMQASYREFLNNVYYRYGEVPIVFILFPKELDVRPKFRDRHDQLEAAIRALIPEFPSLRIVAASSDIVDWPERIDQNDRRFPYHYNAATYKDIAAKVRSLGVPI